VNKQTVVSLCLIAAAGLASAQTAGSNPAPAGSASHPFKVGVIETQAAILNTKDGQKASDEFKVRFEPRKKELDQKAAEIRDLQAKLQNGGAAMNENAKLDLQRSIDQKTKAYNRDMEDANAEFQQEQQKLLGELEQKMMQVIDKYAQANGYAVIIDVSNPQTPVMYASSSVNITKDIVELYDKTVGTTGATTKPTATPAAPKPTATPVKKQP
jgi:outer membrane protein